MPETETSVKKVGDVWPAKALIGGCTGCEHDDKRVIEKPCVTCITDPKHPHYQARKLPGFDKCSICMKLDRPECGRPACEEEAYKDFVPFPVIKKGPEISEQEKLDVYSTGTINTKALTQEALDALKTGKIRIRDLVDGRAITKAAPEPKECCECDYSDIESGNSHSKCKDCGPELKNWKEPPPSDLFNPKALILGDAQNIVFQPSRDWYPKLRIFIPEEYPRDGGYKPPIQITIESEAQMTKLRDFLNTCLETQKRLVW